MTPGRALRVGLRLPQYAATWDELRAGAELGERLGFDGLWVNDHFWTPGRRHQDAAFEAVATLAAIAPLTRRVRLGTVVLSAAYRPPALTAKVAAVLDAISRGRLVVGLGTGSDRPEHEAYGIPFADPKGRGDGVVRALDALQALFAAPDGATVAGLLRDAPGHPRPVQRPGPPIWLAGHKPRLLRLAGARCEGIVAAFCAPEEVARRLAIADQGRAEAGRADPLECCVYTYALPLCGETDGWLRPEADALGTTPAGLRRWLRGVGLLATPDELAQRLEAYRAAGATDVVLVLPNRVPPDAVVALAEAVLPPPAAGWAGRDPDVRADAGAAHLLVGRHAERDGDAEALIDDVGTLTFAALQGLVERASGALADAGARRGERVVVALRDGRGWVGGFLGAAGLGAVAVPADPLAGPDRLIEILTDCEPTVVVAEPDASIPAGPWTRLSPGDLGDARPRSRAPVHPADLAYLVYSSGSTGRPKAAMHSHDDLRAGIETYARHVLGLAPGDRCHSVARLFTSLGFGNGFVRVLGSGATAVMTGPRPSVRGVVETVAQRAVSVLTGVPTFWAQLVQFAERHPVGQELASVRLAVSSGDSLPRAVADRVRDELGLTLVEGLGCSECSNIVISTMPSEAMPGRLGRVVPGIEIRLADPDGRDVAPGEPGRLMIRSASNTSGYWRRPDLTRDLVHGEWLRMGDVLVCEEGVYRHVGRADDLFKVDALWVSPTEIESALVAHPLVAEAAVVARPDDQGLLRAAAFVVLAEGADPIDGLAAELRRHVAVHLDARRAPRWVVALPELPRLASGKLARRALPDLTEGGSADD